MMKRVFLAVLFVSLGVFLGMLFRSGPASKSPASQEITSNKVILGTFQTVTGTVVAVSGKTMEIENEGDRLTVNAAVEVFINTPAPSLTPTKEDLLKTVVGQHAPPSIKASADFSSIKIGERVIAQMKKNEVGEFVVFSVDYQKE